MIKLGLFFLLFSLFVGVNLFIWLWWIGIFCLDYGVISWLHLKWLDDGIDISA